MLLYLGRKFGWGLSKVMYVSGWLFCVIGCVLWGFADAYCLRVLINLLHPGVILKIFGFGTGAYVSIPNYGLLDESTIPESALSKHLFIKGVPMLIFIVCSVVFAFTMR